LFEKELSECKKKISDLEDENDLLRNRADYFEKETSELEKKDSAMLESCFRELGLAFLNTKLNKIFETNSKILKIKSYRRQRS
jgi:hypothetical protein